ncbi:MAG: PD-(D/E)XK nuclease family protein [Candidatus Omnitrophica bacterium]|nr:PD-(D/E)XK nuclease family protein [Candidatus Omnitrophota bacterium]
MSEYYTPKREKNLYDPKSKEPFKLSRSKIELFIQCPRCFYLDRRLGVGAPPSFPYTLNSAVDILLKKEFDLLRKNGTAHPLMTKYGVDAFPAHLVQLEEWRNNFKGVQVLDKPTNLLVFGAIDDLWRNSKGEYMVVDYKSTSKPEEINALDKEWHGGYKRQMEIYQWLLRGNGFNVIDTGYFVYCNGNTALEKFDGRLEFNLTLIPYEGDDSWVSGTIKEIHKCLNSNTIPLSAQNCDMCAYRKAVSEVSGDKT